MTSGCDACPQCHSHAHTYIGAYIQPQTTDYHCLVHVGLFTCACLARGFSVAGGCTVIISLSCCGTYLHLWPCHLGSLNVGIDVQLSTWVSCGIWDIYQMPYPSPLRRPQVGNVAMPAPSGTISTCRFAWDSTVWKGAGAKQTFGGSADKGCNDIVHH